MPANVFETATKPSRFVTFDKVHNPLRLPRETTSERPKWSEHLVF
jgi:LAS superfamily LD-carboxypeptidase LdcB